MGREARRIWSATANSDGPGLLERGLEYQPRDGTAFDPMVVEGLVRLARLAESIGEKLRDCPDADVRRSAAILAARAHPIRAALDS
jgi:hypothetical protein